MKLILLLIPMAFSFFYPVKAATVQVRSSGFLSHVVNGDSGAAIFLSKIPLGSRFDFNFSYDNSTPRTSGGIAGGSFLDLPIDGVFNLGGVGFALPEADASTNNGMGGSRPSFSLFANFPFSGARLNGFSPVDFRFQLINGVGSPVIGISLPPMLRFEDFQERNVIVRFAGPRAIVDETTLGFTLTSLTSAVGIPEPDAWIMFIVGFGMIGGIVRRGHRSVRGCIQDPFLSR